MTTRRSFLAGLSGLAAAAMGWMGLGRGSRVGGTSGADVTDGSDLAGGQADEDWPPTPDWSWIWGEWIYGIGHFNLWEYNNIRHPFESKEELPRIPGCHLVDRRIGPLEQFLMLDGFTSRFRMLCVTWEQSEHDDPAATEIIREDPLYINIRLTSKIARIVEMIPGSLTVDYDVAGDVVGMDFLRPVKVRDFMRALILPMGCTIADLAKFSTGG